MRICSIDGCNGKHRGLGYCNKHLLKFQRHGDPLIVFREQHREHKCAEHRIWSHIKGRCNNPTDQAYKDYGGRGIKVCDRWNKYSLFLEDMGRRPSPHHTIDRKDNDKGYFKDNCRWVTSEINAQNRRSTKMNKEKVIELRKMYLTGLYTITALGILFNITRPNAACIIKRKTWRNIK